MLDAIRQEVVIDASPKTVYETFLDAKRFGEFAGGPAQIDPRSGGTLTGCGGIISGRNIKLVPYVRIVQAWRVAMWPDGVYSIVSIALQAEGSKTRLTLHHAFPETMDFDLNGAATAGGWDRPHCEAAKDIPRTFRRGRTS